MRLVGGGEESDVSGWSLFFEGVMSGLEADGKVLFVELCTTSTWEFLSTVFWVLAELQGSS